MRILTVGASPYLFTKLSRINSDLLCYFKENNEDVASACWHLNFNWYLPEDDKYYYEKDNNKICRLYPISYSFKDSSSQLYDVVKDFKPDVVVSIGDLTDIGYIYSLKLIDPNIFKWVSIFTIDSTPVNEEFKDVFEMVDVAISVNKFGQKEISNFLNDVKYIPYGPNEKFKKINCNKNILVINNSKNSQTTNIPAVIEAMSDFDKRTYINTNISDRGDYNLINIAKVNKCKNVKFPKKYSSVHRGISDELLNIRYNKSDIFIDSSVRSSTGISMLEAMSTGCIPVGTGVGAIKEILDLMPEEYRFIIDSYKYYGNCDKEYQIVSIDSIKKIINKITKLKEGNLEKYKEIQYKAIEVSNMFSRKKFLEEILRIVRNINTQKDSVLRVEEI